MTRGRHSGPGMGKEDRRDRRLVLIAAVSAAAIGGVLWLAVARADDGPTSTAIMSSIALSTSTPFTGGPASPARPVTRPGQAISSYPAFGAPAELVDAAKSAGYDGCSNASNHSLDRGRAGIEATLNRFDADGLHHAGMARTADEAATITMYDVKGMKVAHLSYAYGLNGNKAPVDAPWAVDHIDPARTTRPPPGLPAPIWWWSACTGARSTTVSLVSISEISPLKCCPRPTLIWSLAATPMWCSQSVRSVVPMWFGGWATSCPT